MAYVEKFKDWPVEKKYGNMHYVEVWKKMEELVDDNLAKSIGVSNFNAYQVNRLVNNCRIKPVMNQVEVHAWHAQFDLVNKCQEHGIQVTAYAPIGSPTRPPDQNADLPVLMEDPTVVKIAKEYNKTPAQILIRFAIERGIIVIPKSGKKQRIYENGNIFDFKLYPADMQALFALNKNQRYFPMAFPDHRFYPFRENYTEN